MVLTVKDAMEARLENSDVLDLVETIDEFLGSLDAVDKACDLGDVESFERIYISQAYEAVGWKVRWEEDREGGWNVSFAPDDKR